MRGLLQDLLDQTADANERSFAIARLAFTTGVLARFVVVELLRDDPLWSVRTALELPSVLASICFSVWSLHHAHRRRLTRGERRLSVAADATLSFVVLLGNVLWPWPTYRGILHTPDVAVLLLMTVAAGYRLSSTLAWLGGALNLAAAVTLWGLDILFGDRLIEAPGPSLAIYLLYLSAGTALAVLVARRTETLVQRVAAEAGGRLRTASRLEVALYTQHDVRSLMASATLNAGLLRKRLEEGRADALEIAQELEKDLGGLSAFVGQRHDSLTTERPVAVVTAEALARVVEEVHRQVPTLEVCCELRSRESLALVGGEQLLRRLLVNLLLNAAEGDGSTGATRCVIRTETDRETVRLVFEDNGPGFTAELLSAPPAVGRTTKEQGSGLGLSFVRWVVEDSGGILTCANHAFGARVTLALPTASAPLAGTP